MKCLILFLYFLHLSVILTLDVEATSSGQAGASNLQCILPEYPAFGRYVVAGSSKDHHPGDRVPSYSILQYSCDQGYFSTNNITYCRDGIFSDKPQCQRRKVVCYFPSWANYRKDQGKFDVEDINPNICTHLIFAFVGISDEPGIKLRDPWNELYDNYGRGAFSRFVKLKEQNSNLKVMVALGGWSEGSLRFSQSFNTSKNRMTFSRNAAEFLLQHKFDGMDIVWEFPAYNGGAPEDKENFIELIKTMRTAFDEHSLLLSATVAAPESYMEKAYDAKALGKYLDFIIIKTRDLHGSWEPVVNLRAPLFPAIDEIGTGVHGLNVHACVQSWIAYGAPPHKLVLGLGLYGRSFNLTSLRCKLPRCGSSGSGAPGKWTNEAGILGYNEICLLLKDSSVSSYYDKEAVAPYLVKDNLWVGYDNKQSLEQKVNYLLYNNLGGASVWSLDTDDFSGACEDGKFPLTSHVYKTVMEGFPTGPKPEPFQQERKKPAKRTTENILVCYYASWSVYRKDEGKFDVEDNIPDLCTHLVFAFVGLTENIEINVRDPWNDLYDNYGRGALNRFTKLKDQNPNLVVLLAIGGYGEQPGRFSQSVDTPEKRNFFVQNSRAFLLKYGFDGLDINWEFPGQRGGNPSDKENYKKLLQAMREEYDKHSLLLTALVASTQVQVTDSYDIRALGEYLDFISIKTFDMHGPWHSVTGHHSPLYGNKTDRITVDIAIKTWIKNGAPANKLVMGISSYGRSFTLSSSNCASVGCPSKSGGTAGKLTNEMGMLGYNEICLMEREPETKLSFDKDAKAAYLQKGDQWVSYENKESIRHKVDYIMANNLAGAVLWTTDTDDFKGACGEGNFPLISTLNRALMSKASQDPDSCSIENRLCFYDSEETSTTSNRDIEPPKESGCPLPEFPIGGQYVVGNGQQSLKVGDIVPPYTLLAYSCKKTLISSHDISFCQEDSTWSANPICSRRCRMPQSFSVDFTCWDNKQNPIKCEDYVPSGTVVRYQCKHYHHNANFYNYRMTCDDGAFDYAPPRCVPECGAEPSEGVTYIINGSSAKRGTFPWHVAIYESKTKVPLTSNEYQQICGGSIIATHLVVSAAHCFYLSNLKRANSPSLYAVGVGKFARSWLDETEDSNPFVQKSKVKNIFIPTSYGGDGQSHQSDIAILELVTPIQFSDAVHPICINLNNDDLNRYQLRTGNLGKVAGWGLTTEEGPSANELEFLKVPIIDYAECKDELDKYNFGKYLTLDKICAGYTNGSALCRGDSGGGLVFPHRDTTESRERWYLRGIVSVGPRNDAETSCRKDTYTAYTQVHYFKEWISEKFIELKV